MAVLPGGGYAEYAKVLKSQTMPMFIDDWEQAAAIPVVWSVAY